MPVPRILALRGQPPATTAFLEARKARLKAEGKSDTIDRRPVALSQISPALVKAVLAAEDSRFFTHRGIDPQAIAEARAWNARHARDRKKRLRGASTITQQLAKNLYLSGERTWLRKGREAAIALTIDALVPKQKILEHYLSAVEWGERIYGCEAAARRYFGIPARALSPAQGALLAAMIPRPSWYAAHAAVWQRRADRIARLASKPDTEEEDDPVDGAEGSSR